MKTAVKDILQFMEHSFNLKKTKRTGWVREGIADAESVSDHTLGVVYLALAISKKEGFDENKIVKMALVHDISESIVGDIVAERGTTDQGLNDKKKRNEIDAARTILASDDKLKTLGIEYLEGKSKEAMFVKELDKLEMVMQALHYEKEMDDSKHLVEFWQNAAKYIHSATGKAIFEELKKQSKIATKEF